MKKTVFTSCLLIALSFNQVHANYEDPETGLMPGQTEIPIPSGSIIEPSSLTSELEVVETAPAFNDSPAIPEEPVRIHHNKSSYEILKPSEGALDKPPAASETLKIIEVSIEDSQTDLPSLSPEQAQDFSVAKQGLTDADNKEEKLTKDSEINTRKCLQEGRGFFVATGCLVSKFGASVERTPEVAKGVWSGIIGGGQRIGEVFQENTKERKDPAPIVELKPRELSN